MNEIETSICVKTENQIMELIQEFASSWSLVGGRFDNGSMLEIANNLNQEIRAAYEALYKENDDQKRKIISLENELVEWNEFKKIRDAQMQALRKQMP